MTFNIGNIAGGSNAGWRRVKEKPGPWQHPCVEGTVRELPGYHVKCPDCKAPRGG